MSNLNDSKILAIKEQIKIKKEKLEGMNKRFVGVTNCIIFLDGEKYNLNVLKKDELIMLAIKIESLLQAAKGLKFINEEEFILSGYKLEDWIKDIELKLEIMNYKEEQKKLNLMEEKLTKLLSEEKKVELEINEIVSMLDI